MHMANMIVLSMTTAVILWFGVTVAAQSLD
jgi:cytochrome c oxidase assembly factor CtaG